MALADSFAEILISEVKRHPNIYDVSRQDYRDKDKKLQSWKAISEVVGHPCEYTFILSYNIVLCFKNFILYFIDEECKTKWNYLRDTYRLNKKKQRNRRSGAQASAPVSWPHFEGMSFLDDSFYNKRYVTELHLLL